MNEDQSAAAAAAAAEQQLQKTANENDDGVVSVAADGETGNTVVTTGENGELTVGDGQAEDGVDDATIDDTPDEPPQKQFQSEDEFIIALQNAEQFLQTHDQILSVAISQIEEGLQSQASIQSIDDLSDLFDLNYKQVSQLSERLKDGLYDYPTDNVYTASEQTFNLINKIEDLLKKKDDLMMERDIRWMKESGLGEVLSSDSNEGVDNVLDGLAADGTYSADQIENTKKRFEQVQEFAGMTLDTFIKLNEGSSLETFLAFLYDPINTGGKEGAGYNFNFGQHELADGSKADLIPLPQFRVKFKEAKTVAKALALSAEKINPDWALSNRDKLEDVKLSGDPKVLKDLMLDMYTKLMVNSDKRDENTIQFRLHFGTSLFGGEKNKFLDDSSFGFFVQNMKNGGEELSRFWDINATTTTTTTASTDSPQASS